MRLRVNPEGNVLRIPKGPWVKPGDEFECPDEKLAELYIRAGLAEPVEGESPPPETAIPETPEEGGDAE